MLISLSQRQKITLLALVVGIILFVVREGCNRAERNNLVGEIANYSDSAKFYKLKVGGMSVEVAYNKSLVLENKEQLEQILKKNDTLAKIIAKFSDIKGTTIIKEKIIIQRDTVRLTTEIPCDFAPIKVVRDSAYYHFAGTIAPKYFTIDSLIIPNKQSIVLGTKKVGAFKGNEGFLKNKEQRVEIVNSNPLIKTSNIESFVISDKKKFYEKAWFHLLVGGTAGFVIAQKVNGQK